MNRLVKGGDVIHTEILVLEMWVRADFGSISGKESFKEAVG